MKVRVLSALLLIAIIALIPLSVCSCNRSYNKETVINAAKELLPKAAVLNSIYYGNGISYISSGFSDGNYREADPVHLELLGIKTVSDIRSRTLEVFSTQYAENLFEGYLESYEAEGTVWNYARYVQSGDELTGSILLVNKDHESIFDDRLTYHLDTVTDVESKGDLVKMSVEITVEDEEGNTQHRAISFYMYEERIGWRISSPCISNYNKYLDNELLK
ncbi:MAG: hypothetical protein IKC32_02125 [Clostridia bacterium]|nr:hypothetical protein [Clostridia bacterium]